MADLARLADPIAVVRIDRIHQFDQGRALQVAKASVERCLLGNSSENPVVLAWKPSELGEGAPGLTQGALALVFANPRAALADEDLAKRLANLVGPGAPRFLLPGGLWRFEPGEHGTLARVPASVPALPDELSHSPSGGTVPVDDLLAWLDAELSRITPSAGACWITTGPAGPGGGYSIELEPDGEFNGTERGLLAAEELASFWRTIESEKFRELPDLVGRCKYPDQSSFEAWTRDRSGLHRVRIFSVPPGDLASDSARDELARALRVWSVFPGSKRPQPPP